MSNVISRMRGSVTAPLVIDSTELPVLEAALKLYGGKVLARGGKYKINEGPQSFHRFVVIEFDSLEQGVKCFDSAEYQAAASFRRNGGGVVENVIIEGGEATVI